MEIRKKDPTPIGPAESTYQDWSGTAVAENSLVVGSLDLYELAGLDRDRWSILGIDVTAFSHGADPSWEVHVYAADKIELAIEGYDDWANAVDQHGGVPVVDVKLHGVTFDQIIKTMKLVGVQLRSRLNVPLLHSAYADHPDQL